MLKQVKEEERLREEAGYYDEDLDSDDEETRRWLENASKIEEKEKLRRLEHSLNKTDKPQIPRRIIKKRERTMDKLEEELGGLGVDMKKRKMANLLEESEKPQRGKSVKRVGRSLSLQPKTATPKDQLLPDVEVSSFHDRLARLHATHDHYCFSYVRRRRKLAEKHNVRGRRKHVREKQTDESSLRSQSTSLVESEELERHSAVNTPAFFTVNQINCYVLLVDPDR